MQTFLMMATSQKIMHSSLGNAAQTQQQHQLRMKTPAKSSCTISCSIKHEVALEYSLYPIINSPSFNAASKLERALAIINSPSFIKFAHSFSVYAVQQVMPQFFVLKREAPFSKIVELPLKEGKRKIAVDKAIYSTA